MLYFLRNHGYRKIKKFNYYVFYVLYNTIKVQKS